MENMRESRMKNMERKKYTLNLNIYEVSKKFRGRFGLLPFAGIYSKIQKI